MTRPPFAEATPAAESPVVSVLIASDRVAGSLSQTLDSLAGQAPPPFEVIVASAQEPSREARAFPLRWVEVADRNPAARRNRAASASSGRVLAFLDDDAAAEPGWLSAGVRALESCEIAGGPDPGPAEAPYGERLANLLLATPLIGSGVPAHEASPRAGPVRSPHDVALCNLFVQRAVFERLRGFDERLGYVGEDTDLVRRALSSGARVVLDPAFPVRHRRRAFPGPYLAQRWRYRVKTGRLLVERPGLHDRARIGAFLAAGFLASAGAAIWGPRFLVPAVLAYALLTWALSFPLWRRDFALLPAVPFAFALHHATYFVGLLAGIARGLLSGAAR